MSKLHSILDYVSPDFIEEILLDISKNSSLRILIDFEKKLFRFEDKESLKLSNKYA